MDKYEEAAHERLCQRPNNNGSYNIAERVMLADDFRWYDAQREKEMCKWTRRVCGTGETHWYEYTTSCGRAKTVETPRTYCPYCGRRIKEVKL